MSQFNVGATQSGGYNQAAQISSAGRNANHDRQLAFMDQLRQVVEQQRAQALQSSIAQANRAAGQQDAAASLASSESIAQQAEAGANERQAAAAAEAAAATDAAAAETKAAADAVAADKLAAGNAESEEKRLASTEKIVDKTETGATTRQEAEFGQELTIEEIRNNNKIDLFEQQVQADEDRNVRDREFQIGLSSLQHLQGKDRAEQEGGLRMNQSKAEQAAAFAQIRYAADQETKTASRERTLAGVAGIIDGSLKDKEIRALLATSSPEDRYLLERGIELKYTHELESAAGGKGLWNLKGVGGGLFVSGMGGEIDELQNIADLVPNNKFIGGTQEYLRESARSQLFINSARGVDLEKFDPRQRADVALNPESIARMIRQQSPEATPEEVNATLNAIFDIVKSQGFDLNSVDFGNSLTPSNR